MKIALERSRLIRHAPVSGRADPMNRREILVVSGVLTGLAAYLTGLLFLLT